MLLELPLPRIKKINGLYQVYVGLRPTSFQLMWVRLADRWDWKHTPQQFLKAQEWCNARNFIERNRKGESDDI